MNKKYAMPIEKIKHPNKQTMMTLMKKNLRRKWTHVEPKHQVVSNTNPLMKENSVAKAEFLSVLDYNKKVFGTKGAAWGNLWRYPRIRRRLESSLSRYVYPNSFDSRKNFRKFLLTALDISFGTVSFEQQNRELKNHLKMYLLERMSANKITEKRQFIENFKLTLELVDQKINHLMSEAEGIKYDTRDLKNPLVRSKDRKKTIVALNASDSVRQLLFSDMAMREAIPPLMRAADEIKREFPK